MDPDRALVAYSARREALRSRLLPAVATLWDRYGGPTDDQAAEFGSKAVPLVRRAQGATVTGTDAYLSLYLGEKAMGLNPDLYSGAAVRNGTDPSVVYHRPIVTLRAGLADGKPYDEAKRAAGVRLAATVDTDLQLSHRSAARDIFGARGVVRFARRTSRSACDLCRKASGEKYYRGDLLPIHPHCGCIVVPIERGDSLPDPPSEVPPVETEVHEHEELGPMLTNSEHNFARLGEKKPRSKPKSKPSKVSDFFSPAADSTGGSSTPRFDELNPAYFTNPDDKGFRYNCTNCVTTYELRFRGAERITAAPVTPLDVSRRGIYQHVFLGRWKTPEGITPPTYTVPAKQVRKVLESWGEGKRAFVFVQWKKKYGGGGHVFSGYVENGKAHLVDPQNGKVYAPENDDEFWKKVSPGQTLLVRSDNLTLERTEDLFLES